MAAGGVAVLLQDRATELRTAGNGGGGTAVVLCGDGASWWWREDGRTRALMDA